MLRIKVQGVRGRALTLQPSALDPYAHVFLGTSAAMTHVSLEPSHTLSKVTGSGFGMSEILLW